MHRVAPQIIPRRYVEIDFCNPRLPGLLRTHGLQRLGDSFLLALSRMERFLFRLEERFVEVFCVIARCGSSFARCIRAASESREVLRPRLQYLLIVELTQLASE